MLSFVLNRVIKLTIFSALNGAGERFEKLQETIRQTLQEN